MTAWDQSSFVLGQEGEIPAHEFMQMLRAFMGLAPSAAHPLPRSLTPRQAEAVFAEVKRRRHDLTLFPLCAACALESQAQMQRNKRPYNLPAGAPDPAPQLPKPATALLAEP